MAIRPVEVQGVVQRSHDIGQLKQNQDQRPLVEQNNIQTHMHRETERSAKQVTKFENSDKKENRYDAKEKGNGTYFGQKKKQQVKQQPEDEDAVLLKSIHHGSFDVKV